MFPKVPIAIFIFLSGLLGKTLSNKDVRTCYSCEALDRHLPMSNCYFTTSATNTTSCPDQCLFFQYIVAEEEYTYYDSNQNENMTIKGNIAHTVRACAPVNATTNSTCLVNSTAAIVRQCVLCDTDLCNESSKSGVPATVILLISTAFLWYATED